MLTATDSSVAAVTPATLERGAADLTVSVGRWRINFKTAEVGFSIESLGCSLPADVDGDGKLSTADLLQIIDFATGEKTPSAQESVCADLNGDGKINILDVLFCLIRLVRGGSL